MHENKNKRAWLTTLGTKACVGLLAVMLQGISLAQAEPLQQATGEAILSELKAMRVALERMEKAGIGAKRQRAPTTAKVSIKDRPVIGKADAPVTLVEFTDYECPYCNRFTKTTFGQLKAAYVDAGKLRIVVKDSPLMMHTNARKAAQAAHCAGEQDAYWPMHMLLFDNAKQLGEERLPSYAAKLKLDGKAFASCITSDRHLKSISSDMLEAKSAGISGAPAFVLGVSNGDHVQGNVIVGAQPLDVFKRQIDALLAKQVAMLKPAQPVQ
mgnify:CR=1 FL=1